MQINNISKENFGQIYCSPATLKQLSRLVGKEDETFKKLFLRNWEACRKTDNLDMYVKENLDVFIKNKSKQTVFVPDMSRNPIWNVDTGLKQIIWFEEKNKVPTGINV